MDVQPAPPGPALVHWMGLADANNEGYVHGGVIMKLCDEAAALAATRHSHSRVVTAAVDRLTFLVPVHVGELVTFSSAVNAVWRTSMEVGVRVEAENPRTGEIRHTNSAYITMVALDPDGAPAQLPPLTASDPASIRRASEAQARRSNRLAERDALRRARQAEQQA
jgi:acyl-CoA hydrolase